jgi:hypothetical protein
MPDEIDLKTKAFYDVCNKYLQALIKLADAPTAENKAAADVAGAEWEEQEKKNGKSDK